MLDDVISPGHLPRLGRLPAILTAMIIGGIWIGDRVARMEIDAAARRREPNQQ